jgi:cation transport ATPase
MTASAKPEFSPTKETYIAGFTLVAIALHVALKYALQFPSLTQSALGGMGASMIGMLAAAFGLLPPIWGAVGQELIDLFAVLNAVRVALPTEELQDY